jgi:hypothetical protein
MQRFFFRGSLPPCLVGRSLPVTGQTEMRYWLLLKELLCPLPPIQFHRIIIASIRIIFEFPTELLGLLKEVLQHLLLL